MNPARLIKQLRAVCDEFRPAVASDIPGCIDALAGRVRDLVPDEHWLLHLLIAASQEAERALEERGPSDRDEWRVDDERRRVREMASEGRVRHV